MNLTIYIDPRALQTMVIVVGVLGMLVWFTRVTARADDPPAGDDEV